ncbi:MAG: hypothetical protein KDI16_10690 [Halioglobus sp.]|nr:hypothetical protein [Halioglobus sp.]
MADCCPCCGYRRFGSRPIAEMEADNIRQWAETSRVTLARGNLLRPGDAASYTGRALRTVRRWMAGDLSCVSIRGRKFISVDALAAFIVESRDE